MRIKGLFDLFQGNSFELINMDIDKNSAVNFVARSSENNGVTAKVRPLDNVKPFPAGSITVALSGSVLSSFVQHKPFYTGFHVMVLHPKKEMRLEEKLFYCHCIKMNAYRYGYGRQANKTLKDIPLPPLPDWLKNFVLDYSPIATKIQYRNLPIDTATWKKYRMEDLFVFHKGKRIRKEDMSVGGTLFIAAIDDNNGVRQRIAEKPQFAGNCITVNYNGSIGEAFYQSDPFCASDDVNVLYPKGWILTPHIGLFLATIIRANKYRFTYGRKWTLEKMLETNLALPTDKNGEPDWKFMENYVKSLPYSDRM